MIRSARTVMVAVSLALVTAGCGTGGSDTDQVRAGAGPTASAEPGTEAGGGHEGHAGASLLPTLEVVRVQTGAKADLATLAEAGKPALLWFWAPHCTICRAEAPDVLDFASRHGDEVQVLGLGAQDDLDQAEGFLDDTGISRKAGIEMVWDAQGAMWRHYEVTNQPTIVVLDGDGKVKRTWFRDFDANGILAAAGVA